MKRARILARDLHDDQSGAVLIWVSVMIVVIFGFVALAIDGARYLNLNSNMQQIADAAALAGAKELDGSASAMKNATAAAKDYLKNNATWSDINRDKTLTSDIVTVNFYDAPPDGKISPLSDTKANNQKAAYIEVVTTPRGLNTTFAVTTGNTDAYTTVSAVARVAYSVCRPVQSFFCNPYETSEGAGELGKAVNFDSPNVKPGQLFLLGARTYSGPGQWGFISPLSTNSSPSQLETQNFWAGDVPQSCEPFGIGQQVGPVTDTGADTASKARDGMNVRFDIPNTASGAIASVRAPIVTDGYIIEDGTANDATCASKTDAKPVFNWYTRQNTTDSKGKPVIKYFRKTCTFAQVSPANQTGYAKYCNARFDTASTTQFAGDPPGNCKGSGVDCSPPVVEDCDSLTSGTSRIGSCPLPRDPVSVAVGGVDQGQGPVAADLKAYWENHHSTTYATAFPSGASTRRDLYHQEYVNSSASGYFDVAGVIDSGKTKSVRVEKVNPVNDNSCKISTVGNEDRRLISVAIIDCDYWSINGKSNRLPTVTKNAVFFMTEQATADYNGGGTGASNQGKIYAEYVGAYEANQSGGSIFQQVELVK